MNGADEAPDPLVRDQALQLASQFLGDAMDWVYQGGTSKRSGVIIRTYALLFMVNPKAFGNQAELAASLGVSRKVINTAVSSFRDQFGYALPSMRTEETRTTYSKLKTEYHATKRKAD